MSNISHETLCLVINICIVQLWRPYIIYVHCMYRLSQKKRIFRKDWTKFSKTVFIKSYNYIVVYPYYLKKNWHSKSYRKKSYRPVNFCKTFCSKKHLALKKFIFYFSITVSVIYLTFKFWVARSKKWKNLKVLGKSNNKFRKNFIQPGAFLEKKFCKNWMECNLFAIRRKIPILF